MDVVASERVRTFAAAAMVRVAGVRGRAFAAKRNAVQEEGPIRADGLGRMQQDFDQQDRTVYDPIRFG